MFYTMEEAAIIGGFLELYLERDSVDPVVREQHRRFRQGLMRGTLERADYEWAAAALGFLRPQWWPEQRSSGVGECPAEDPDAGIQKRIRITICGNGSANCCCRFSFGKEEPISAQKK